MDDVDDDDFDMEDEDDEVAWDEANPDTPILLPDRRRETPRLLRSFSKSAQDTQEVVAS